MHIMIAKNFPFAYDGHIVFSMTGYHTCTATSTSIEVDAHTPFDAGLIIIWVKGTFFYKIISECF